MKARFILTALLSALCTTIALKVSGMAPLPRREIIDNARAKVTELVYQPGVPRERYTRATDQIIVFLDDCKYQRLDPDTHETTIRERRSGDAIWHDKGEIAPVLVNMGPKPYRTLVIELK